MGLLDDAIRDHIDLKRRHGADPGEVARIESEALGPARREPVAPPPYDDETDVEPATVEEPVGAVSDERTQSAPRTGTGEELDEPEPAADAAPEAGASEPVADVQEPAPPFDVEQTPEAPSDPEAEHREDVLEETPEFLQETPEHDRLWFEQKPPRDFDF